MALDQWPERERRIRIFVRAYEEIVALERHTDEKLRSVLALLAFLTAAGVTLYTFAARPIAGRPSTGPKPHDILAISPIEAGDIFFALFMLGMALSIAAALVAL